MNMKMLLAFSVTICALIPITACDTGIYFGSRGMGIQSGEVVSAPGYVIAKYPASMDRVWEAVKGVMESMKAVRVKEEKKIAEGEISGFINEEKVAIEVRYVDQDTSEVGVLVGVGGNRLASEFIHEKIAARLKGTETPAASH